MTVLDVEPPVTAWNASVISCRENGFCSLVWVRAF